MSKNRHRRQGQQPRPQPAPPAPVTTSRARVPVALDVPREASLPSGIGTVAYNLERALDAAGILAAPGDDSAPILLLGEPARWRRVTGRRMIGFAFPASDELAAADIVGLHAVDVVLVPSQWAAEVVSAASPRPVHIVPLGVDPSTFPTRRRERGDRLRIMHFAVSGVDPRKGADLAIRAFRDAFPAQRRDVELVLRSAYAAAYDTGGDNRIRATRSSVARAGLSAVLEQADAVIAPSRAEAFPLAALEAMVAGFPTIIPSETGFLDLGDVGLRVSARRGRAVLPLVGGWFEPWVPDLVAALRDLDENFAEHAERAEREARMLADRFTWSRTAAAIAEILEG